MGIGKTLLYRSPVPGSIVVGSVSIAQDIIRVTIVSPPYLILDHPHLCLINIFERHLPKLVVNTVLSQILQRLCPSINTTWPGVFFHTINGSRQPSLRIFFSSWNNSSSDNGIIYSRISLRIVMVFCVSMFLPTIYLLNQQSQKKSARILATGRSYGVIFHDDHCAKTTRKANRLNRSNGCQETPGYYETRIDGLC